MEPADVADQISEAMEGERRQHHSTENFRSRAAITIAGLAMLLAIASLGGDNATKEAVNHNILASDAWAFYQAKNIRRTSNQIAAKDLEATLTVHSGISEADRQALQRDVDSYKATAARYADEPDPTDPDNPLKGEGLKQLMARAQEHEHRRDHALAQDPNFDYSTALFQIAIVLGSVAIVANSLPVLLLSLGVGSVATVLMLNGFFLLFDLPIG